MRSIDLGAMEVVRTYDELAAFNKVGSPFSIPKAALVLAGFHPDFSAEVHASLEAQLEAFGAGIEITCCLPFRRFRTRDKFYSGFYRVGSRQ